MKLARGEASAEDVGEVLKAMGIELQMVPVLPEDFASAFQLAARASQDSDAKLLSLAGKMKTGERLVALLVLVPAAPVVTHPCVDRHILAG
jgi:hypothetical protein